MNILEPGFNPGGLEDKIDSRDYQYAPGASAPFDWNAGFDIEEELAKKLNQPGFKLPVKNQNSSFSCGGQAWATYAAMLEAIADGSHEERSAKFIYAQTFAPGGGSWGRPNCDVCKKQGAAREAVLTSYENGNPPSEAFMERLADITDAARADASHAKEISYGNVAIDIDTDAQAIRDGYGVIFLVHGSNNYTWRSAFPQVGPNDWGHWIYAGKAKVVDGKKYIGVLNSWGAQDVGENGWQWLNEEWFTSGNVVQAWVMVFDQSLVVPPPPPPQPPQPSPEQAKTLSDVLAKLYQTLAAILGRLRQRSPAPNPQ